MVDKPVGVVIDTNLWVSMALGSRIVSAQMLSIIEDPTISLYVSVELLEELTETLAKPRLQKYLTQERTRYVFDLIWLKAQLVQVTGSVQVCRDHKDDFVIDLAVEANARYIITGDDDLLTLQSVRSIEVVTITGFLQKMQNS